MINILCNGNFKMELIGKSPVNTILFITGKVSGYAVWLMLILKLKDAVLGTAQIPPWMLKISIGLFAIGLTIVIVSWINLGKSTRIGLPKEKTKFVASGLYLHSRNPMYVGFYLITFASMIINHSIIIIFLGIFSTIVYHLIILGEEKFLENRFGKEYAAYKAAVPRYL
jgi:protein-S-isoprenylcysteine O-methyltransferase Ste14